MSSIRDIPNTKWRDELLPASFRSAEFHVETGSKENGRRIIVHEFPKKEEPYSEDMGRAAFRFTVRGYCVAYPINTPIELYRRDYRIARNALIKELQKEGGGILQLPTLDPVKVVCERYRLTETERLGGYCVFDMTFAELGRNPFAPEENSVENLRAASAAAKQRFLQVMTGKEQELLAAARATTPILLPP
jgi:prophage DNA circulation protein